MERVVSPLAGGRSGRIELEKGTRKAQECVKHPRAPRKCQFHPVGALGNRSCSVVRERRANKADWGLTVNDLDCFMCSRQLSSISHPLQ